MKKKIIIFCSIIIILSFNFIIADSRIKPLLGIKTKEGMYFASNNFDSYFLFELKCNDLKYEEKDGVWIFYIENTIIQHTIAPLDFFANKSKIKNINEKQILILHMYWELKNFVNTTNLYIEPDCEFKIINNQLFSFWYLNIPREGVYKDSDLIQTIYITTKIDNNIIVFNASILESTDKEKIDNIINHLTESLIIKTRPIKMRDLKKLIID